MRTRPPTALIGSWLPDDASRARVRAHARDEVLIDVPQLIVGGDGEVGRSPRGTLCVLVGRVDRRESASDVPPTRSAAAQLAQAYDASRTHAFAALRGRWLAVIWDAQAERCVLARDALGARSLHLSGGGRAAFFGEDARDVIDAAGARPPADADVVAAWIAAGLTPERRTLFEGIERIEPAGWARLTASGVQRGTYWQLEPPSPSEVITDAREATNRLRDAVDAAVRRAAGDGEVGVLLSGGLDSSTVAAAATHVLGAGRVRAYSGVFPEHPAADETELIAAIVDRLGIRSRQYPIRESEALAGAMDYVDAWAVPPNSMMNAVWAQALRDAVDDGVGAMLSGEGGDEVFGNTPQYVLTDLLRRGAFLRAWRLAPGFPGAPTNPRGRIAVLRRAAQPLAPRARRRRVESSDAARGLLRPESVGFANAVSSPLAWVERPGPYWWRYQSFYVTSNRELLDVSGGLRRRAAQAGLATAEPLLHDRDLVELALRISPELQLDRRFDRPVARAGVRDRLPASVLDRRGKSHFTEVPAAAFQGRDRPAVRDLLRPGSARVRAFLDPAALDQRLLSDGAPERHPGGVFGWLGETWRVAALEYWLQQG